MSQSTNSMNAFSPVRRLFIAAFVFDLAIAMVGLSVQFLGNALGAKPMILGLLGMASPAAYALGCLFTGRLSDRVGRRVLVSASCLICAAAWLAMTQVKGPLQLLAIIPISGAAISLFWPPLQAWLSEITVGGHRRLVANIGSFNISWTVGLMLGPPAAGLAWGLGPSAPFVIAAISTLGLLFLLQSIPDQVDGGGVEIDEDRHRVRQDPEVARHYLHLAWIANCASWFGKGMNLVVFPKLALDIGFTAQTIGLVLAMYLAGQLMMFIALRSLSGWQFRLWPLLAALVVGSGGWMLAYVSQSPLLFAAAFAVAGMGAGVTYASSLFYSVDGQTAARGARTGIHEAVLGSGVFLGPLFGGAIADYVGLQEPYLFAAVFFCIIAAILVVVRRSKRGSGGAAEPASMEVAGK